VNIATGRNLFGPLDPSSVSRPNLVAGMPVYLVDSTVAGGRRFKPAAFSVPPAGIQGNLGRNVLRGFAMAQVDLSLRRQFRLSERLALQFRADLNCYLLRFSSTWSCADIKTASDLSAGATHASSIEEKLMARGMETVWQAGLSLCDATLQFVYLAAFVTVEMMMMFLARYLVPWGGAWDLNAQEPVVFKQCIDVPIDGGNSKSAIALSRTGMGFLGRKRTARVQEGLANRFLLFRVSHATSEPETARPVTSHRGRKHQPRNCKLR
jgi:hypothetical protein